MNGGGSHGRQVHRCAGDGHPAGIHESRLLCHSFSAQPRTLSFCVPTFTTSKGGNLGCRPLSVSRLTHTIFISQCGSAWIRRLIIHPPSKTKFGRGGTQSYRHNINSNYSLSWSIAPLRYNPLSIATMALEYHGNDGNQKIKVKFINLICKTFKNNDKVHFKSEGRVAVRRPKL